MLVSCKTWRGDLHLKLYIPISYKFKKNYHRLRLVNYKKISLEGNNEIGETMLVSCKTWRLKNGWI